jgi:hypothetical protein
VSGGKGLTFDNDLLKLIFQSVGIPNLADNAATAPLSVLYVSLHTQDPGANGYQNVWEAGYSGYARVAVARSPAGWTISGNILSPAATISFPICTGGAETEIWAAVGTSPTGQGKILYRGPISPSIPVTAGVTPQLSTGSAFTEN